MIAALAFLAGLALGWALRRPAVARRSLLELLQGDLELERAHSRRLDRRVAELEHELARFQVYGTPTPKEPTP